MSATSAPTTVRPELVEGQPCFCEQVEKEERCFDKLSTNGLGAFARLSGVRA